MYYPFKEMAQILILNPLTSAGIGLEESQFED